MISFIFIILFLFIVCGLFIRQFKKKDLSSIIIDNENENENLNQSSPNRTRSYSPDHSPPSSPNLPKKDLFKGIYWRNNRFKTRRSVLNNNF